MRRFMIILCSILTGAACWPAAAFAHVVVTPDKATIGSYTTFTISVPNEKSAAVTSLKIELPASFGDAQPTVQNGWNIDITKNDTSEPTAFTWSGNSVPAGQRAEFSFRGQAPAKASTLDWKAYQTYEDGSTVAWDQKPDASGKDEESETSGPYSVTSVVDDLAAAPSATSSTDTSKSTLPLLVSLLALVLSVVALIGRRPKIN